MNWTTKYEYTSEPIKKDWGEQHENFQIDATMSIREMVQRYNSGQAVPVHSTEYFDQDTLHPSADLTEKYDYIRKIGRINDSHPITPTQSTSSQEVGEVSGGGETPPPAP